MNKYVGGKSFHRGNMVTLYMLFHGIWNFIYRHVLLYFEPYSGEYMHRKVHRLISGHLQPSHICETRFDHEILRYLVVVGEGDL